MANAYGIVHQYGEPQSTFDADLAINVLGQKQQQFDANQQKIDQTLAQMGLQASMIENDDAKKYLSDRVNQVIQETQNLRTSDIGSKDSTRKILSTINTALDDKALKHIGYGQEIQQFNASVNAAMEEGKYADQNYQDAVQQAGLQEYIQGDVNADLGNLNYNPFVDVNMGLVKKVKDIKASMGEQFEEVINAEGVVEKVKINNLTDAQWQQVLPRYVDDQMKTQIEIEGRARFGWNKENVVRYAEQAIDSKIEPLKKGIEKRKSLLQTDGEYSEFQKKQLKDEIATAQRKIEAFESQKLNQDYDMTTLGGSLVMEDLINTTASIVGNDPSIERDYSEVKNTSKQAASNNALFDSEGNNIVFSDTKTGELQEITEQTLLTMKDEARKEYLGNINAAYNTLPTDLKKETEELAQSYREEDPDLSVEDSRYMAFTKKASKANSEDTLNALNTARTSKIKYGKQVKVESESYKNVVAQEIWKDEEIYESVIEKGAFDQTKIVLDNGQEVHSKDYLESQGVKSYQDYLDFLEKPESIDFKGQVLADYALSESNTGATLSVSNLGYALEGGTAVRFSREDYHNIKSLIAAYGEEMNVTDLLSFNKKDITLKSISGPGSTAVPDTGVSEETLSESHIIEHLGDGIELMKVSLNPEAKNRKAYKALEKRLQSGNYKKQTTFVSSLTSDVVDESFYSDKTIRSKFKRSNVIDRLQQERDKQNTKINTPKKITLQAGRTNSKASNELVAAQTLAASSDARGRFKVEKDLPMEITINPLDPGEVIIEQMREYSKADYNKGVVDTLRADNRAVVDIAEFANQLPDLYARLDLNEQAGSVSYLSDMEEEREGIAYLQENDRETAKAYINFFQGNPKLANSATKDASLDMIENILPEDTREVYSFDFQKAIQNSDKFSVKLKRKGDAQYIKIFSNYDGEKKLLNSIDVSSKPPEELLKTFNVAPQILLTQYFETIAQDIAFNSVNNGGRMSNRFKGFWELIGKL